MKTELTFVQSLALIRLGVHKKKASGETLVGSSIFTLTDLLSIIPKEVKIYGDCVWSDFKIEWVNSENDNGFDTHWKVSYVERYKTDEYSSARTEESEAIELIDAIYDMLIWLIKSKYIKS